MSRISVSSSGVAARVASTCLMAALTSFWSAMRVGLADAGVGDSARFAALASFAVSCVSCSRVVRPCVREAVGSAGGVAGALPIPERDGEAELVVLFCATSLHKRLRPHVAQVLLLWLLALQCVHCQMRFS